MQTQRHVLVQLPGAGCGHGKSLKLSMFFRDDVVQRLKARLSLDLNTPRGVYRTTSVFNQCNYNVV